MRVSQDIQSELICSWLDLNQWNALFSYFVARPWRVVDRNTVDLSDTNAKSSADLTSDVILCDDSKFKTTRRSRTSVVLRGHYLSGGPRIDMNDRRFECQVDHLKRANLLVHRQNNWERGGSSYLKAKARVHLCRRLHWRALSRRAARPLLRGRFLGVVSNNNKHCFACRTTDLRKRDSLTDEQPEVRRLIAAAEPTSGGAVPARTVLKRKDSRTLLPPTQPTRLASESPRRWALVQQLTA